MGSAGVGYEELSLQRDSLVAMGTARADTSQTSPRSVPWALDDAVHPPGPLVARTRLAEVRADMQQKDPQSPPWALDDNVTSPGPLVAGAKLADVARSCLQNAVLRCKTDGLRLRNMNTWADSNPSGCGCGPTGGVPRSVLRSPSTGCLGTGWGSRHSSFFEMDQRLDFREQASTFTHSERALSPQRTSSQKLSSPRSPAHGWGGA